MKVKLFAVLMLLCSGVASVAQTTESSLIRLFTSESGVSSCVDIKARYAVQKVDRAAVIERADFNLVMTSLMAKYPTLARIGEIPDQFLYWKKADGGDLLLLVLARDGDACVYASASVAALPDVAALGAKYFR